MLICVCLNKNKKMIIMSKRTTIHDKKIRSTTSRYKRDGWSVRADIPGYKSPDPIGKYNRVPDIVVKKGKKTRIIEIETPKSLKTDCAQRGTFKKHAANKQNTTFKVLVARKPKKRKKR